jgi:hypothetical protein
MVNEIEVSIAQEVSLFLQHLEAGFDPTSGYMEFVVDKMALEWVLSEYLRFLCQLLFHQLLHNH